MAADARDEDLLRRYERGDERAFEELVRRHEERVFAVAYRMTGDRADALDATQETFIAAFRQAASFRGDSAFATWLHRICVNACLDLLRKRARSPQPLEEIEAEEPKGDAGIEADIARRLDLADALGRLSEEYRTAVVMHDVGGLPYEEIARATGVEVGTVKSRISRGRRRLAEMMEQPTGAETSKR